MQMLIPQVKGLLTGETALPAFDLIRLGTLTWWSPEPSINGFNTAAFVNVPAGTIPSRYGGHVAASLDRVMNGSLFTIQKYPNHRTIQDAIPVLDVQSPQPLQTQITQ